MNKIFQSILTETKKLRQMMYLEHTPRIPHGDFPWYCCEGGYGCNPARDPCKAKHGRCNGPHLPQSGINPLARAFGSIRTDMCPIRYGADFWLYQVDFLRPIQRNATVREKTGVDRASAKYESWRQMKFFKVRSHQNDFRIVVFWGLGKSWETTVDVGATLGDVADEFERLIPRLLLDEAAWRRMLEERVFSIASGIR